MEDMPPAAGIVAALALQARDYFNQAWSMAFERILKTRRQSSSRLNRYAAAEQAQAKLPSIILYHQERSLARPVLQLCDRTV